MYGEGHNKGQFSLVQKKLRSSAIFSLHAYNCRYNVMWNIKWRICWNQQITWLFASFSALSLAPLEYLRAGSTGAVPSSKFSTTAVLSGFPQPQPAAFGAATDSDWAPHEPWRHNQLLAQQRARNNVTLRTIAAERKRKNLRCDHAVVAGASFSSNCFMAGSGPRFNALAPPTGKEWGSRFKKQKSKIGLHS